MDDLSTRFNQEALIVVDAQNDFCAGGALAVPYADEIIEPINELMRTLHRRHTYIAMTRDWHPHDHVSFGTWPRHCVAGTGGAQFHRRLLWAIYADSIFSKGLDNKSNGYSGVEGTDLVHGLNLRGIKKVYVVGLATDYCVRATVLDLIQKGFEVAVITDCIRAVNLQPNDGDYALATMREAGAALIESKIVLAG